MFDPKAEGIIFNRIDNACFFRLKGLEVGGCDGFAANQVVQAVQKPAAEGIAVRTLFGVQLEDQVVIENLIAKANDEGGDVASDVAEMTDFNLLCISDALKDALQYLDGVFFVGNEDIYFAWNVFR